MYVIITIRNVTAESDGGGVNMSNKKRGIFKSWDDILTKAQKRRIVSSSVKELKKVVRAAKGRLLREISIDTEGGEYSEDARKIERR